MDTWVGIFSSHVMANGELLKCVLQTGSHHNLTCAWKRDYHFCTVENLISNTQWRGADPLERLCSGLANAMGDVVQDFMAVQ